MKRTSRLVCVVLAAVAGASGLAASWPSHPFRSVLPPTLRYDSDNAPQSASSPRVQSQSSQRGTDPGGVATPSFLITATPRATITPTLRPTARPTITPHPTAAPKKHASRSTKSQAASSSARPATAKYLVLLVIDGGRPDYLAVPGIPHIRALMQAGTSYNNGFAGILESETPSGHAAIGTGSEPRNDGILSFAWATNDNIAVNLFDPATIRGGAMEKIMTSQRDTSIASVVHSRDRSAKVVALSGHKYYAADAIGGPNADVIEYYSGTPDGKFAPYFIPGHPPPAGVFSTPGLIANTTKLPLGLEDHLTMRLAEATFQRMHPKVLMVNLPEFDWPLGHVDGGDRNPYRVKVLMQGMDNDLAALEDAYRKAGILDQTLFVITGDHGFAPIYHTVDYKTIENAVTAAGTSILSDTFHTAGYLWIKDWTKGARAAENIALLQNPYIQSVYFKTEGVNGWTYLRASGPDLFHVPGVEEANQYLLHTFADPNGPNVVVFFREQAASEPGGQAGWKGDHGGADWQSQHMPLVFSGPGVRRGVVSNQPARLIDIAPTALTLLGLPHPNMDGIVLADALLQPPPGSAAQQSRVTQQVMPVVTALQREAAAEVAAGSR